LSETASMQSYASFADLTEGINHSNDLVKNKNADKSVPLDNNVVFQEHELVEISSDLDYVKFLQRGHGEWADSMLHVSYFIKKLSWKLNYHKFVIF
jgi:hypothetical protein